MSSSVHHSKARGKRRNDEADRRSCRGRRKEQTRSGCAPRTVAALIEATGGAVRVAVDTEYAGPHTLTVQFAARHGDEVVVQVYHSPAVQLPKKPRLGRYLGDTLDRLGVRVVVRPPKPLTRDLSPARVLADLFDLPRVTPVPWPAAIARAGWGVTDGAVAVELVGHYLTADFFRMFGAGFFEELVEQQVKTGTLTIQAHKTLGFRKVGADGAFSDPVLAYAGDGDALHPIRVRTFDTWLPFGPAGLDRLATTFLRVPKLDGVTGEDKADMLRTFREKPGPALAYAVLDAVLTLLLEEKMRDEHGKMYGALGLTGPPPKMQATLGSRVTDAVVRAVAERSAGSARLSQPGRQADGNHATSLSKVRALMQAGGGDQIAGLSQFGKQTGETHGGLLYSRSPTEFFHAAPGMFRDVDLSGCYAAVISRMSLYVGQPVVHEPGGGRMRLRDAVAFLREHAAGPDAWVVKVSGPVTAAPNALIPSTNNALTHANFRSRAAKKRAGAKRRRFVFDWLYEKRKETGNATLFTDVIEAGVVAWPTWLMIQALPPAVRAEYENLEVETVLFYPAALVADDGPGYDALAERLAGAGTPWSATLDMAEFRQVVVKELGDEYAALRFDLGDLARRVSGLRRQAREECGKGSGAELAWKVTANSMYGVLASRYLVTNNVVSGNYVTAAARAVAFAMQQALNGFQVITDGCTYRADQVPAATFAECLARNPDYPVNRAGPAVPFRDPAAVPADDGEFTTWYRAHVKRFFGVSGPDYDALFGMHALEHKTCGPKGQERAAFDGLCCDGSGQYLKLFAGADGWQVTDPDGFKARGYRKEAKDRLAPWVIRTFSEDAYTGPPPVTESPALTSYKDAGRIARKGLQELSRGEQAEGDRPVVYYPLGLEQRRVRSYRVIKPSGFLFRTPGQKEKFVKAVEKFFAETGCGLELLALRRSSPDRRQGSVRDVAKVVYALIRGGEENFTKALNLTRPFDGRKEVGGRHRREFDDRRAAEVERLVRMIDARSLTDTERLTGWYVSPAEIILVE